MRPSDASTVQRASTVPEMLAEASQPDEGAKPARVLVPHHAAGVTKPARQAPAQPQPQPQPQPMAKAHPQPQPQPQLMALAKAQPKPQPEPVAKVYPQSQPQPPAEQQPTPRTQPAVKRRPHRDLPQTPRSQPLDDAAATAEPAEPTSLAQPSEKTAHAKPKFASALQTLVAAPPVELKEQKKDVEDVSVLPTSSQPSPPSRCLTQAPHSRSALAVLSETTRRGRSKAATSDVVETRPTQSHAAENKLQHTQTLALQQQQQQQQQQQSSMRVFAASSSQPRHAQTALQPPLRSQLAARAVEEARSAAEPVAANAATSLSPSVAAHATVATVAPSLPAAPSANALLLARAENAEAAASEEQKRADRLEQELAAEKEEKAYLQLELDGAQVSLREARASQNALEVQREGKDAFAEELQAANSQLQLTVEDLEATVEHLEATVQEASAACAQAEKRFRQSEERLEEKTKVVQALQTHIEETMAERHKEQESMQQTWHSLHRRIDDLTAKLTTAEAQKEMLRARMAASLASGSASLDPDEAGPGEQQQTAGMEALRAQVVEATCLVNQLRANLADAREQLNDAKAAKTILTIQLDKLSCKHKHETAQLSADLKQEKAKVQELSFEVNRVNEELAYFKRQGLIRVQPVQAFVVTDEDCETAAKGMVSQWMGWLNHDLATSRNSSSSSSTYESASSLAGGVHQTTGRRVVEIASSLNQADCVMVFKKTHDRPLEGALALETLLENHGIDPETNTKPIVVNMVCTKDPKVAPTNVHQNIKRLTRDRCHVVFVNTRSLPIGCPQNAKAVKEQRSSLKALCGLN